MHSVLVILSPDNDGPYTYARAVALGVLVGTHLLLLCR